MRDINRLVKFISCFISPLLLFIFSSYVRNSSKLWKDQSNFLSTKVQWLLFRARLIQMCDTIRKIESHITQHMNRPCWLGYVKIVMYCTSQSQNTCSTLVSTEGKHFLLTKLTYRNRFPHSFSLVERGVKDVKRLGKVFSIPLCSMVSLQACNFTNKELTFMEVYWSIKSFEIPTPSFPINGLHNMLIAFRILVTCRMFVYYLFQQGEFEFWQLCENLHAETWQRDRSKYFWMNGWFNDWMNK